MFLMCGNLLIKSEYSRERADDVALYMKEYASCTCFPLISIVVEYDILNIYFVFPLKLER